MNFTLTERSRRNARVLRQKELGRALQHSMERKLMVLGEPMSSSSKSRKSCQNSRRGVKQLISLADWALRKPRQDFYSALPG
jgi:hypothetical protein